MPEFIPAPQLPQGMAEELIRLKSHAGDPWAQLARSLGSDISGGLQDRAQRQAQTLTPEQIAASRAIAGGQTQFPGAMPPGQVGPGQPKDVASAFPGGRVTPAALNLIGQQMSLAERMAASKEATARAMGVAGVRGEQAAVKDHTPATDEMIKNYPALQKMGFKAGDLIPNRFISEQSKPAAPTAGIQTDKFIQGELDKFDRAINPANAQRGTLVGILGQNNARALRALQNLKDPNMVVQQLDAVTQDVAGIMQGGAPHESGIATNRFSNILTKWSSLKSELSSDPKAINNPEVVKKLTQIVNDIKKADNQALKDNIEVQMKKVAPTSKKYPEFKKAAEEMRDSIMKGSLMSEEKADSSFDELYKKHGLME